MELEKLYKLIEAGYTKEEIEKLEKPEATEQQPAEEKPAEPAPEPEANKENELLSSLLAEMQAIRDDLRKRSLIEDGYRPQDSITAAEQILADVIDPPALKKKKK